MPRELLPELISDILLRLPAECLLRFRCVSSSLCHEIDSPNFAQNHLNRSIETRSHRKLIFTNSEGLYAADFDHDLKNALKFNNQFTDPEQYNTSIVGSCRGLILLSVYQKSSQIENLFLWNPTSRQLKMLPPSGNPSPEQGFCYGLGYDSVSDDYKVVRITTIISFCPGGTNYEPSSVWVFSLKSNSWRWTQDIHLDISLSSHALGFANGFFDLENEVFIPLPSFRSPQDGGFLEKAEKKRMETTNAFVIEENVLMHEGNSEGDKFYSPVVDEVDALPGGNWIEKFSFKKAGSSRWALREMPLAYSKDEAYVLLISHNDMFWYNMEKKTRRELEGNWARDYDPSNCYVIWGSLVSLGNDGIIQV